MDVHLTERKKEVFTGLFAIVFFFGAFLAAEIGLRMVNLGKFGTASGSVEKSKFYYVDESTGLRLQTPNATQGNIVINSLGYRGPEIATPKPRNTIRLVFLGSSTTQDGYASNNDATWPHRTVEALRTLFPDCSFDYVNAGIPGYSVSAIMRYFESYVQYTEPDVTVIYALDVQSALASLAKRTGFSGALKLSPSWLARHSLLWEKIEKNLDILKLQRAAFDESGKLEVADTSELTRSYEEKLSELIQLTNSYGLSALVTGGSRISREQTKEEQIEAVQTTLYYIPYVSIHTVLNAYEVFNETIARVAAESNAVFIGGEDEIPSDLSHYADSVHFTDRGSRLMGERVSKKLAQSSDFQELLRKKGDCRAG